MPTLPRVVSTGFVKGIDVGRAAGSRAIVDYLERNVGDDCAVAEIERPEGRFSLVLDGNWLQLAHAAHEQTPALLDDLALPRNAVRAVVAGWQSDWEACSGDLTVDLSPDHVPHLRLASLRHSPAGADENAQRS